MEYATQNYVNRVCHLAAISGTTVPFFRVTASQMKIGHRQMKFTAMNRSCPTQKQGASILVPAIATRVTNDVEWKMEGGFQCSLLSTWINFSRHDDVIKWKHFPRYWPFVRGIHRSPVNSLHKGQWRGAFMFSLICAWINGWVNNREAGGLRRLRAHYDVIVMQYG